MTLRLRLLLWLAPLAMLLIGLSIWFVSRQTPQLEFKDTTVASQETTPRVSSKPKAKPVAPTPQAPSAKAAEPDAAAQRNENPFVADQNSVSLNVPPAVPTPKPVVIPTAPRTVTLAQLQTRTEPALLRFNAGQLEEVRASDVVVRVSNQSSLWLWAVLLLTIALFFGSYGVRRSLIPLERFAADIASRNANQLEALATPPLPELKPAVNALNGLLADLRNTLSRTRLQEQSAKRFAYNASHELRNPLTAARNYLEVLERHPEEPFAASYALEAVRRTERVLGSLLTLARLEGRGTVQGQPIALRDFLEANFELPVQGDATINAERDLLELAIENLVKNAEDHGSGATQFTLEITAEHTWIWLEDKGIGFSPEILAEAFEPFVKQGTGTGLGLAIVAAIADAHAGKVKAENLAQGGARVGIGFLSAHS